MALAIWGEEDLVLPPVVNLAAGDDIATDYERRANLANRLVGEQSHLLQHGDLSDRQRRLAERVLSEAQDYYRHLADSAEVARSVMRAVRGGA